MTGIYKITNLANKKLYIGKAINIENRWKKHLTEFRNNKHNNKHLQASWNKYTKLYGEEIFKFEIILQCHEDILNDSEEYFISYYNTTDNRFGYNKTSGGDGISNYKHSDEAKEKIRQTSIGRKLSDEHKNKLLAAITGRVKSEEELQKLSIAAKGRKISDWHKQQLINSTKGKPFSESHRKNLSQACKGRIISEKQRRDISNTLKGRPSPKKITPDKKEEIEKLLIFGMNIKEIAKQYNVCLSTIYGIKKELAKIN